MDLGFQTKASMKEENMPKKLAAVPRNEVGLVVVENELPYKKVWHYTAWRKQQKLFWTTRAFNVYFYLSILNFFKPWLSFEPIASEATLVPTPPPARLLAQVSSCVNRASRAKEIHTVL